MKWIREGIDNMNLKLLASDISKFYKQNPKVEAVLLGGSLSRNWEDEFSDIELIVLWREAPTDEDRKAPIKAVNGSIIDLHPYEEEEWSETYLTENVKLEISNFLTQTIMNIINDVTLHFDTDLDKQCIVASVHNGIPLVGTQVIENLKNRVREYPLALSDAMIRENIDFGNRWNNREALLSRKDWLMLYKVIVSVQTNIMGILFGLNRLYVHHPAFKWQKLSLETMSISPEKVSERLEMILLEHPKDGLNELELIIQEIYHLLQKECPHIELSGFIEKSLFVRPKQQN
jgi:hypothetical protein